MDKAISNHVTIPGQSASTRFPSNTTYVPFEEESGMGSAFEAGSSFANDPTVVTTWETPFHQVDRLVESADLSLGRNPDVPMLNPQHLETVFENPGTLPSEPAMRRPPANEEYPTMLPEASVGISSQTPSSMPQGHHNPRPSAETRAIRRQSGTSEATAPRTATSRVGMRYRRRRADKLAETQQSLDRVSREKDELRQRVAALTSEVRVYRELLSMGRRNGAEMFTI